MVLRDHDGSITFCSCRQLVSCDDIAKSEIHAIKEGLLQALQWSDLPIVVESDCLEAVSLFKSTGDRSMIF